VRHAKGSADIVNKESKTHILIIENDENVLLTNKRVLTRALGGNILFYSARSITEARESLRKKDVIYDAILLDVMLPDGSGLEFIPEIHSLTDAPILILSARNTPPDITKGIERGGDYFIAKPYEPETMTTLVHAMLNRERNRGTPVPTMTITRGKLTLDLIANRAYIGGIDMGLMPKEFALLSFLMREEDKAISAEQLYKSICKSETDIDKQTFQKHISTLRLKLESGECGYTIRNAHDKGYCFEAV